MKRLMYLQCLVLCTACGQAVDPTKKTDAPVDSSKTQATDAPKAEPVSKEEATPKVAQPETVEKAPELTKDQMVRASIRLGFDGFLAEGKLFHDETFKTYFYRGDEGSMGYADSLYLPVTTKNVSVGCPMGFKQVGQIDLSIGISHGLFDHMPPESLWVWTSWKSPADTTGNSYYAYVVDSLTDQWGYHFDGGFFYPRLRTRTVGRLYCMMSDSDLPNIDDLPAGYFDSLRGH